MTRAWFDVNREGLAKILERRGKQFAVAELISNAWDQNVTTVNVTLEAITGKRGLAALMVEDDDPHGFTNLTHAYTLFAESEKKGEAAKRGRFNLGEKLVLALCEEAKILSTTGGVIFDAKGRRTVRDRREAGSVFYGTIRMNKAELEECFAFARTLIPPAGIVTTFNGEVLRQRQPKASFELALDTHIADQDGVLRKSVRKTTVTVYDPLPDEVPSLYEMGIPVVETGDKWHLDIGQKVPLSLERDNVPPAYLRRLRAETLNQLFQQVQGDEVSTTWVKAATEAPEARPEAVEHVVTQMFGPKRVIFDPSDQEANKLAVSQGYTVIHPRSLSAGQWQHVKEHQMARPAGQVTPSPKAIFGAGGEDKFIPPDKWQEGMRQIADYTRQMGRHLMGVDVEVQILNDSHASFLACYGQRKLIYNVGRLGYRWFEGGITQAVDELMIHEFGHEFASDHLSEQFHDALCTLGAQMKRLALLTPELFRQFEKETA
jgi:hypothetical protein